MNDATCRVNRIKVDCAQRRLDIIVYGQLPVIPWNGPPCDARGTNQIHEEETKVFVSVPPSRTRRRMRYHRTSITVCKCAALFREPLYSWNPGEMVESIVSR